jgi:hypothetical protein
MMQMMIATIGAVGMVVTEHINPVQTAGFHIKHHPLSQWQAKRP